MEVSLHAVHEALVELGKFRFGEMRVEDAIREIVQTTDAMFGVDGAGLMLADAEQHLRSVAASDDRFAHLEDLQVHHQEGPEPRRSSGSSGQVGRFMRAGPRRAVTRLAAAMSSWVPAETSGCGAAGTDARQPAAA